MGGEIMNSYEDGSRGKFQTEFAKQLVSFEGLKFKGRNGISNVTPTDIDGLVQLDNENCFIFFELKHSGGVPFGQSSALEKLADAVRAGGTECVVFIAVHNTPYPDTIVAKDAVVRNIYWNGRWWIERGNRTLHEIAMSFIDFINITKEETNK